MELCKGLSQKIKDVILVGAGIRGFRGNMAMVFGV